MTDLTKIYDIAQEIVDIIRRNYQQDIGPDSALTRFSWNVEFNGSLFALTLHLPREWYWVEHGRNPSTKMPPVSAIRQWIDAKRLVPKNFKGIPMDKAKDSMAWAVAKKIQREGFYSPGHRGKHTIEDSLHEASGVIEELALEITKTFAVTVNEDLVRIADGMKNIKTLQ